MTKRKTVISVLCSLFLCHALLYPISGECSETWEIVSEDYREAAERLNRKEYPDTVEIEYNGKLITVDLADLILISDGKGGQAVELDDPAKYAEQLETDSFRGVSPSSQAGVQEITQHEYDEEQRARRWSEVVEDLALREIDEKALELVKEYSEAKNAIPPMTGSAGTLVLSYSTYIPKITCRPMYVTSVMLQPGEIVTGVHPGDPVRWTFVPSISGAGDAEQMHVLIKPLMADISTNLVINTNRRTYHLDLVANAINHIPSVSFSYPADVLSDWNKFIEQKKVERQMNTELSSGYSVSPEDLHLDYEIRGKASLRWKPVRVWDDGVKTYIQFKRGSVRRSVEAPVLVLFERRKEVLVNYRVAEDMYIVDKVFDTGALIAGTGAAQGRVVIKRLQGK